MLPFFETARRENPHSMVTDCAQCKASQPRLVRQSLGCCYEPPAPKGIPVVAWSHPGYRELPEERDEPMCPVYTTKLPEVIEIARARTHWEKGALVSFCGGEQPSEHLLVGIEILDGAVHELRAWEAKERSKE